MVELDRADERREALQGFLQKLDEPQRQLIAAAYGENSDLIGLAQQLGRAPQTIYNKLNAIRRLLADCVTRRLAEEAS